jgi:hypothetical protein
MTMMMMMRAAFLSVIYISRWWSFSINGVNYYYYYYYSHHHPRHPHHHPMFSLECRERVHPVDHNGVRGPPKHHTTAFEWAEVVVEEEEEGGKVLRLEAGWPGAAPRPNSRIVLIFNATARVASFPYKSGTSTYTFEGAYGPVVVAFDWTARVVTVRLALHLVDELMA